MAEEIVEEKDSGNVEEQDMPEMEGAPEDSCHPEEVREDVNDLGTVMEKKWPGWPGENVFRMIVPVQRVGGIIGRKGEYIKKACEETKARIKILDGPPGTTERTVLQIKQDLNLSCGHISEESKFQNAEMSVEHYKLSCSSDCESD